MELSEAETHATKLEMLANIELELGLGGYLERYDIMMGAAKWILNNDPSPTGNVAHTKETIE